MSLTSVAARRFPGELGEMRTQTQTTFSFYGNDDESPIDLRKKTVINRQKSENGNGPNHKQEDEDDDEMHNLSEEEESEKRSDFLKAIQKMSALALPQFLNPLLFMGQKDPIKNLGSRGGGMSGGMINPGLPGYHQPVAVPNPYLLNSLGNLYPLMSEQYGVRYALVSSPDGTHVVPVSTTGHSPYTPSDSRRMYHRLSREDVASDMMHGFSQDSTEAMKEYNNGYRSKRNVDESFESAAEEEGKVRGHNRLHQQSVDNIFGKQAGPESRCASTPPNEGSLNSRKIRSLKHLRESWKSDSKLLLKRCGRFGEDSHCYSPKQEPRGVRELDLTAPAPSKRKECHHPPPSLQRSLSCSDIPKKLRIAQVSVRSSNYHSGYASDSEIVNASLSSSDKCRLLAESLSLKQVSFSDLRTKKRKFYAPSSDDNNESEPEDKEDTMPLKVKYSASETNLKDPKRLKGLRSLSESSIRMKVSSTDCYGPTDLSMKSSPATAPVSLHDHDTFLQQLRHMSPTGFPWNVYGYYNHLMQRFQDQEILKRHLGFDPRHAGNPPHRHHSMSHVLPAAAEAGFSPPTSPSPESSASLTSGWMSASRERRLAEFGANGVVDENNANDPNLRKRPSRALTGKHVKHGTGASPSTLLTLRQKIQERQKAKELGLNLDNVSACGTPSAKHRNSPSSRKSNASKTNGNKKAKPATNVKLHSQSSTSKEPS